ncbi:MAG TPA: neutral zinc metallopeptidase [Ilumatobacteraceae bacterium]|nr:neutral zinc metallopeptidase [Ilumatobacteraceae bacterium]
MTKIRSTDSSNIDDRRGRGGGSSGGSGGLPFQIPGMGGSGGGLPGGLKAGGGLLGIIVLLAAMFLPKLLNAGGTSQAASLPAQSTGSSTSGCVTELEQIVCGVTNDVQDYWTRELPTAFNTQYEMTKTVWFTGGVSTGCGQASSETGPFYCPADHLVYIDLEFMQQLENMLIGSTSDLAEQYILAHEYGHHVQNLLGIDGQVQQAAQSDPGDANKYSVALELQADCFAGAWVGDANARGLLDNAQEIQEAIKAAEGVGDDRIQARSGGRIDPESWTHGSAEQRKSWFMTGFNSQDPTTCTSVEQVL